MEYYLGLIVSEYIGGEPVAVRVGDEAPQSSVFEYPQQISIVSMDELKAMSAPADVLKGRAASTNVHI